MVEVEDKGYVKTKELSVDEIKKIISTEYGTKIVLKDIKAGSHMIMKILEPVNKIGYDYGGTPQVKYLFKCKYKGRGIKPFELQVQVGENAVKRLEEKYPNDSYVDMYCFFSRTKYGDGYPQFINPIKGYEEPKSKEELFLSENDKGEILGENQEGDISSPSSLLKPLNEFSDKEKQTILELQGLKGNENFNLENVRASFKARFVDIKEDRLDLLVKETIE